MAFAHDIAGGQGNLIATSLQSPNFEHLVQGWQIAKDGSAEFNNVVIRGGTVVDGTSLYYSPSPGYGNLVASISATTGTDAYGNAYVSGVATYNGGLTVSLTDGELSLTPVSGGHTPGSVTSFTGTLILTSPTETSGDTQSQLVVVSSAAYASASAAMVIGPAGIKVAVPISADTWHNITLDTGWTAGPQVPQYRLLPDGNVQVRGQATHASVTAVTYVNQSNPIPSAYRPALTRYYRASDPADTAGLIQANSDGTFQVRATSSFPATQALLDGTYSLT